MATTYKLTYKYTGQDNTSATRSVALSKFTITGDTDKPIGKITKITYIHYHTSTKTQSWGLRGVLTFSDGTSITSDNVYESISGNVVKFTNTFTNIISGEKFKLAENIQTMNTLGNISGSSGYDGTLYWRANSTYPMQLLIEFEADGGAIWDENGEQKAMKSYVWKTTNPTTYYYPETAMTSNNSANCTASCSSTYSSSFPAWRAFDKLVDDNCWASTAADTERWIQLVMPRRLYNIKVRIANPTGTNGPVAGIIYGSNDGGSTLTQIGSFSGRSATASYHNTIACNNSTTAYNTVRIKTTTAGAINLNNLAIGEILISGTDVGSSGAGSWVEANPMIWKTSNPITYTYPETAMAGYDNSDCFVTADSYSGNYKWFQAFNKDASSLWSTGSGSSHWFQFTMPRKLYNIKVTIKNRASGDGKGPIEGEVYGTNNHGATLTLIGTFSGLNPLAGKSNTITCTNSDKAYKTVKVIVTKWGDSSGNPISSSNMVVGDISISGTDIGNSGGWVGEHISNTVRYPKKGMKANISQDCIASASSEYSSAYKAYMAFNRSTAEKPYSATTSDTERWIQITLPEPLYNIHVIICNREYDKNDGITEGIIYGSNDNGVTLTEIATISGRTPNYKNGTTTICNNHSTAYSTIRIKTINSNGVKDYCIAEIAIIGTKQP